MRILQTPRGDRGPVSRSPEAHIAKRVAGASASSGARRVRALALTATAMPSGATLRDATGRSLVARKDASPHGDRPRRGCPSARRSATTDGAPPGALPATPVAGKSGARARPVCVGRECIQACIHERIHAYATCCPSLYTVPATMWQRPCGGTDGTSGIARTRERASHAHPGALQRRAFRTRLAPGFARAQRAPCIMLPRTPRTQTQATCATRQRESSSRDALSTARHAPARAHASDKLRTTRQSKASNAARPSAPIVTRRDVAPAPLEVEESPPRAPRRRRRMCADSARPEASGASRSAPGVPADLSAGASGATSPADATAGQVRPQAEHF